MLRKLSLVIIVIAAANMAFAMPPPNSTYIEGYNDGWGMCPVDWEDATGGYGPIFGLWDPIAMDWAVNWDDPLNIEYITYDNITLQLWVELFCITSYQYTSYVWHRVPHGEVPGEGEEICFSITGTVASNSAVIVALKFLDMDLGFLHFMEGVMYQYGDDLPIEWSYRWGEGVVFGENQMYPNEGLAPYGPVGYGEDIFFYICMPCDHWFEFVGCFYIPYHCPSGYYYLEMGGCPIPEL